MRAFISGERGVLQGQLRRLKKLVGIRGLNRNQDHDLKNIFKGAATRAAIVAGPFQAASVARRMKPPMARLTVARKIAAIALLVWKKGVRFDAQNLMKAKHDEDADGKAKPVDHEFKLDEPLPKWQGRYSLRAEVATTLAGLLAMVWLQKAR